MRNYRKFIIYTLIVSFLSVGITSCAVIKTNKKGKKKGWYKNTKNPHHPNTTKKKQKSNN